MFVKLKNLLFQKSNRSRKKKGCYFCGKTTSIVQYTDGHKKISVCALCTEYAHRRAYKRI
jgi:hypothetical protein